MLRYLVALVSAATMASAEAEYLGSYTWERSEDRHGGYSGLEVFDGGTRFVAIADNGQLVQGRIERDGDAITGMRIPYIGGLHTPEGKFVGTIPKRGEIIGQDSEGLARTPQGSIYVSFESDHRVWFYAEPEGPAAPLPLHHDFSGLKLNVGLEGLAIDTDGTLFALPETTPAQGEDFPVYRYRAGVGWDQPFTLRRDGAFLITGADIGPDGRLYVLERLLRLPFGFASRVRVFTITETGLVDEETLLRSRTREHDNLEGIAVWRDETGAIRLTMISDDNYNPLQKTEVVEYRLTKDAAGE